MTTDSGRPAVVREEPGTVFLSGRITSEILPGLMDAYARSSVGGTVLLDFSGIESIDVPGLNALIKLLLHARQQGGRLRAAGLGMPFQDVFRASRIDEAVPFEPVSVPEGPAGYPQGWPWARPVECLKVSRVPEGALNLNIDGLHASGPVQGFGRLWEKTYEAALAGPFISPGEVIRAFKENFPSFQPPANRFYPSPAGIVPGEVVIINAKTPAGLVSTGVWVLHADDESFTFMTPQGHPESGWVTFSAFEGPGRTIARIQGLARAGDPLYEIGFELMGSREQEGIWRHVLVSLARHFGIEAQVSVRKVCVGNDYQWSRWGNVRHNAQILTMVNLLGRSTGF